MKRITSFKVGDFSKTVICGISKKQVKHRDIFFLRELVEFGLANPEVGRKMLGNLSIFFDGYDDDPREIYEIKAIRQWYLELDRQLPYVMVFLNPTQQTILPYFVFLCHLQHKRIEGGTCILMDCRKVLEFIAARTDIIIRNTQSLGVDWIVKYIQSFIRELMNQFDKK